MKEETKEEEEVPEKTLTIGGKHEIKVSNDIREHLLQSKNAALLQKFEHEYSATWKTDQLQVIKLFEIEMDGEDPFYVEGQDQVRT